MRHIYKYYREIKDRIEFEEFFSKRISGHSTVLLPFKIKPIGQQKEFQLYFIPTTKILELTAKIYKNDGELNYEYSQIPPIAQNKYVFECMIEELHNTNTLEGVRSSREEIVRSARLLEKKGKNTRFSSMITSYLKLLSGDEKVINGVEDIKEIYEDIVHEEIEDSEKLDGKLFRKEITYVFKSSGSGKMIHMGVTPEDKIISLLNDLIYFLNNHDLPMIIKIAISHYYFGYIHPFYDGNGRTSRFISSVYLQKEFSKLTAISLSKGCNNMQGKYYEVFNLLNSVANRGEVNCFVEMFLTIILKEQDKMLLEIKTKQEMLESFGFKLENTRMMVENELYFNIAFVLGQAYFFGVGNNGLQVKEIAIICEKSSSTIRKSLKALLDANIIDVVGKKPAYYIINEKYLNENED